MGKGVGGNPKQMIISRVESRGVASAGGGCQVNQVKVRKCASLEREREREIGAVLCAFVWE